MKGEEGRLEEVLSVVEARWAQEDLRYNCVECMVEDCGSEGGLQEVVKCVA